MAIASGTVGNWGSGFGSTTTTNNTANELKSQKFDVYQPEQWEAWRKLQSGQAYSPQTLENYMTNYIDPTIQKTVNARVNQARNAYGPSASGYFSASTALAQQRAMQEGSEQATAARAQAALQWEQLRNEMMAKMLEQRPEETVIYRPGSSSISTGMSGLGGSVNTVGNPGAISGYKDLPLGSTTGMSSIRTTPASSYSGGFEDLGSNTFSGLDYNNLYAGMGARLSDVYGVGSSYSSSYPTSSSYQSSLEQSPVYSYGAPSETAEGIPGLWDGSSWSSLYNPEEGYGASGGW